MSLALHSNDLALTDSSHTQDSALVERIRTGDVAAFRELYDAHAPSLLGFALAQLRSRELAEEVVQELFLRLWKHRANWVLVRRSAKAYLFSSLRNTIISHRRSLNARPRRGDEVEASATLLTSLASSEAADDGLNEAELRRILDAAVASLPPRCRETFVLVRRQGLSYAEAADVLGVTMKAVEMNMVRALAALRIQLADWVPCPSRQRGGARRREK
jgi:RNA polymerase sigma-70 factor (ECF subfamily)